MLGQKIEKIISEKVRPILHTHGGDITLVGVDGRNAKVKLSGACSACPAAQKTMEEIVVSSIKGELGSEIDRVILWNTVSDELIDIARNILKKQ